MKKFNSKKIVTMGLAAIMAVSAMSMSAFAATDSINTFNTEAAEVDGIFVPADAPVGTEYDLGSGLKYVVIDDSEFDKIAADAQRDAMLFSTKNVISIQDLSLKGKLYDESFSLNSTYKYFHVAMCNNQEPGIVTTIFVFNPDGDLIDYVDVEGNGAAGNKGWIYSTSPFSAGTYKARFSSSYKMAGSAYGKTGTTAADVVYSD